MRADGRIPEWRVNVFMRKEEPLLGRVRLSGRDVVCGSGAPVAKAAELPWERGRVQSMAQCPVAEWCQGWPRGGGGGGGGLPGQCGPGSGESWASPV